MPTASEVLRFIDSASRYEEADELVENLVNLPIEALDAAIVKVNVERQVLASYERFLVAAKARLED